MSIVWDTSAQGSAQWLEARRGCVTASRFRDARDKLKSGAPSAKALLYAQDKARERVGGKAPEVYANAAMRIGTEQEPFARMAYEEATGRIVTEVGFARTEDGRFGCSVDGRVDSDGMVEIKTLVSSDTLYRAMVDGDVSEYRDQCNGALWLLGLQWVDLCLWAPDLPSHQLSIIRIERDDDEIERLEADLIAFERLVSQYEAKLRALMQPAAIPPWVTADASEPSSPTATLPAAKVPAAVF